LGRQKVHRFFVGADDLLDAHWGGFISTDSKITKLTDAKRKAA
jgi:hypothetical protein